MLTKAEMLLVFVLKEKITSGSFLLTAMKESKSIDMTLVVIKCHSDEESGNRGNGAGKPHKWETQILVGELWGGNWTKSGTGNGR